MTGTKSARSAQDRARIIVHFPYFSKKRVGLGCMVFLGEPGVFLLGGASPDPSPVKYAVLIAEHRDQRLHGASTDGDRWCQAGGQQPPVNNSDSPGSSGNNRPVSIKGR